MIKQFKNPRWKSESFPCSIKEGRRPKGLFKSLGLRPFTFPALSNHKTTRKRPT